MYLAISAVAAMCAFLAAVQTRNAKRLGADLRVKTVEAESFQLTARTMEERLHTEEAARAQLADRITKVETALRESEDTACRLRQELQTERKAAKELQEELDSTKDAHDAAISAMWSARNEVDNLKQENGKLTEALNTERETAKHWKEEFDKEQAYRLSTEGRIMREINNLLRYDGTAHGQEDLSDE
jgi:chromosome segregation ATPase